MASRTNMSDSGGNVRQRGAPVQHVREVANSMDHRAFSLNERILNDVFNIYADKDTGLVKLAKIVDVELPYPRRKVTVAVFGNHSAGKSSFINWYIEETIMKTGVAIETQGFVFVTSGKKRDTLKGQATLQLYPYLKPLQDKTGVLEYLTTEVSTSRSKKFNLVTFVDTPGLVDGDMNYPFDVNETLLWLGKMADLVCVFFDPMGQALCKRTLNIVEKLWTMKSDKVRLYLAKADEAGSETDRQKVLMQIVQELCKRPGLNQTGFEMPTIYLPELTAKPSKCANQINEVCDEIEKVIEQTVQNSLNTLEKDTDVLKDKMIAAIQADTEARKRNFNRAMQSWVFGLIGFFLPVLLFGTIVVANAQITTMRKHIGSAADFIHLVLNPIVSLWLAIPHSYHFQLVTAVVCFSGFCLILSRFFPMEKVLPSRDAAKLRTALEVVEECALRKKTMYSEYLRQSLTEADFIE